MKPFRQLSKLDLPSDVHLQTRPDSDRLRAGESLTLYPERKTQKFDFRIVSSITNHLWAHIFEWATFLNLLEPLVRDQIYSCNIHKCFSSHWRFLPRRSPRTLCALAASGLLENSRLGVSTLVSEHQACLVAFD